MSFFGSPISYTTGGQPRAQVVSLISGATSNIRKNPIVGQPAVIVSSTNTNVVIPPYSTVQPLGIRPLVNQTS